MTIEKKAVMIAAGRSLAGKSEEKDTKIMADRTTVESRQLG
jgi:hypothetical protein